MRSIKCAQTLGVASRPPAKLQKLLKRGLPSELLKSSIADRQDALTNLILGYFDSFPDTGPMTQLASEVPPHP